MTLCKLLGGSRLYGLETPESDYDERYVFLNISINRVIGLGKHEHVDRREGQEDVFGYEFRHFLATLRKTNTKTTEILYAPEFLEIDPLFKKLVIDERHRLMDTVKMFTSLMGYLHNERRLTTGERRGEPGSKRREALDKYGYSPRNYVHFARLTYCGIYFFTHRSFPTRITDEAVHAHLMAVRLHPERFSGGRIFELVDEAEKQMVGAFNDRDVAEDLVFRDNYADWLLLRFYGPVVAALLRDRPEWRYLDQFQEGRKEFTL